MNDKLNKAIKEFAEKLSEISGATVLPDDLMETIRDSFPEVSPEPYIPVDTVVETVSGVRYADGKGSYFGDGKTSLNGSAVGTSNYPIIPLPNYINNITLHPCTGKPDAPYDTRCVVKFKGGDYGIGEIGYWTISWTDGTITDVALINPDEVRL